MVAVRGELDMSTAPELEAVLRRAIAEPEGSVVLDLTDCEFIDSTGIALIVNTWQNVDGEERLVLCCGNHQVRRLLRLTGVESTISMHEERAAALAELGV